MQALSRGHGEGEGQREHGEDERQGEQSEDDGQGEGVQAEQENQEQQETKLGHYSGRDNTASETTKTLNTLVKIKQKTTEEFSVLPVFLLFAQKQLSHRSTHFSFFYSIPEFPKEIILWVFPILSILQHYS